MAQGMQFKFEGKVVNVTTKKKFDVGRGKKPTVIVQRGKTNEIKLMAQVTHTDLLGPKPPAGADRFRIHSGWPFENLFWITWHAEVDEQGKIAILGKPKIERTPMPMQKDGVEFSVEPDFTKHDAKYLQADIKVRFKAKGLALDAPWVEGEGEFFKIEGSSFEDDERFWCELEPEKTNKQLPKIDNNLWQTSVYFGKKDKDTLPTQSLRELQKWTNEIKKSELLHRAIQQGGVPIHLEGHASKSGSVKYNRQEAARRIASVDKRLKQKTFLDSSKLMTVAIPLGKKNAAPKEAEGDYRVDIVVMKQFALAQMKLLLK